MNMTAAKENLMTIAHRLGLAEEEAEKLIQKQICILHDNSETHTQAALAVSNMLSRTFSKVNVDSGSEQADLLVIVGDVTAPFNAITCRAKFLPDRVSFEDAENNSPTCDPNTSFPLILLGACYLCANSIRTLIPALAEGSRPVKEIIWENSFPGVTKALSKSIHLEHAVLVGAGAIGNGFIWALGGMNIRGSLDIIDEDEVSSGNLNRNVRNFPEHVGSSKAATLKNYLAEKCRSLEVNDYPERFEKYADRYGDQLRVNTMITAVDSHRMRRILQTYYPKEIFDASTGGLGDIVFYHNRHPIECACLACIYAETYEEACHEKHIAEIFCVPVSDVKNGPISSNAAKLISANYPELSSSDIVGASFHSLFKQLCGSGQLPQVKKETLETTLAPLCFISVLAGVIIAIELALRKNSYSTQYNFARISPWTVPRTKMQSWRNKDNHCEFCSTILTDEIFRKLWG